MSNARGWCSPVIDDSFIPWSTSSCALIAVEVRNDEVINSDEACILEGALEFHDDSQGLGDQRQLGLYVLPRSSEHSSCCKQMKGAGHYRINNRTLL